MSDSVVIPLYNKRASIERALNSVLSQTISPREIIVIDDGSTDGSGELVKAFTDPRIILIRRQNQGVSAARNRGIAEARGELIAFLDADDVWRPRFLEIIQNLRQKYPEAGLYATAYSVISPNGQQQAKNFQVFSAPKSNGLIANYFRVALEFPVCTSAVAVPKQVIEQVGAFQVTEIQGEDVDLWLRIALDFPLAWSSEPGAIYHKDAANRAVGTRRWTGEPIISQTGRQALADGLVSPDQMQDLREYLSHFQVAAARDCLVLGDRQTARRLLSYARGTQVLVLKWWLYRLMAVLPADTGPRLWRLKQQLKKIIPKFPGNRWEKRV
jgi:glycosyltransferase involved in cell wall biosynthesis